MSSSYYSSYSSSFSGISSSSVLPSSSYFTNSGSSSSVSSSKSSSFSVTPSSSSGIVFVSSSSAPPNSSGSPSSSPGSSSSSDKDVKINGNTYIPATTSSGKAMTAILVNYGDDNGDGIADNTTDAVKFEDKDLEEVTLFVSSRAKTLDKHILLLAVPNFVKVWARAY